MNVQHVRNTALIGGSLAILAGAMLVARSLPRTRRYRLYYTPVRDVGPANMDNPPDEWSKSHWIS